MGSETNGIWRNAIEVPGSGTPERGRDASVDSLSCAAAGNCAIGGDYADGSGHFQAFVVSETIGTWGKAIEMPRLGILNAGGRAFVHSVSCRSAGNCAADGTYRDGSVIFRRSWSAMPRGGSCVHADLDFLLAR